MAAAKLLAIPWFFLLPPAIHGQYAELGPAPLAPESVASAKLADPLERSSQAGNWYDTNDRAAIRDLYNNTFAPTNSVAMGFTGDTATCTAGTVSQAWYTAVTTRLNWFRGMAGVPMGITLNGVWNNKDQQAALMMSRNRALSHSPPSNWLCYTADGFEAAGKSNLCYLSGYGNTDPGCVALYIRDDGSNNQAVGHRRWILYPQSTTMGTGDIAESTYPRTNALWVIDNATIGNRRPPTRDTFVAWPPKGYVPYPVIPSRWSFSYPGANFSGASVNMTRNGVNVSVTLEPVSNGYGENTLVWIPAMPGGNPGSDTAVNITINNVVIGGAPQSFNYQVIIFDPAVAGGSAVNVTINTHPQGRSITVDGANYTAPQLFHWTPGTLHTINVPSPQTSGGTRYVYANWSHGGSQSQTIATPSSDSAYTANFTTEYLLTTSVSPSGAGQVATSPSSQSGYHVGGSSVQVNASANAGYQFSSWSGDLAGTGNPQNVTMNGPRTVTAHFNLLGGCAYSLDRAGTSISALGDIAKFQLETTSDCAWNVTSPDGWIGINSAASGSGKTVVRFTAAANSSTAPRTGTILIAGLAHTVFQAAAGCTFGILNQTNTVSSAAGALNLQVNTGAGCAWTPFPAPSWLTLTSPAANTGSAAANFDFGGNAGSTPRTGSVSAGGQLAHVIQKPANPVQWFQDVPLSHPFADHITLLRLNNVTLGCTAHDYCPDASTTRGQMAAFIIRSLFGESFSFSATPYFTDVPAGHPFFKYVQKMRESGITAGCSASTYCPDSPVTREQMAAFVIRARLGVSPTESFPATAGPHFLDVSGGNPFFAYIQKMKDLGITSGCGASQYCPGDPTTRGQMAVFLIRAFFTP